MNIFENIINYKIYNYNLSIIIIIIFIILGFITFIIVSYGILRILKLTWDDSIFFNQYNKKCQKILDKYGDEKINKIYIVRHPISNVNGFIFNLVTLFQYNQIIIQSKENFPYHVGIIFEISYNNSNKLILLDKNYCINLSENFMIINKDEFMEIQINSKKNKTHTLNKILKKTKKRMGIDKFFNWKIFENNCQQFCKEILITLGEANKTNSNFILRNKKLTSYQPSHFSIHIMNCIRIIMNFIEKYIFDNNIFY